MMAQKDNALSPSIHVVIVTYNGAKWIRECLKALSGSTITPTIHVIDNNSTDNTRSICAEHEIIALNTNANLGFGSANNIGIANAINQGASHIMLLNQDAYIARDCLEKYITRQDLNSETLYAPMQLNGQGTAIDEVFYTRCLRSDSAYTFLEDCYFNRKKDAYTIKYANATAWIASAAFFKTMGGFNPTFYHYGEDDNFIDRIHYHGKQIVLLPCCKVRHDREGRSRGKFWEYTQIQKRQYLRKTSNPQHPDISQGEILRMNLTLLKKRLRGTEKSKTLEHHLLNQIRQVGRHTINTNKATSRKKKAPFLDLAK